MLVGKPPLVSAAGKMDRLISRLICLCCWLHMTSKRSTLVAQQGTGGPGGGLMDFWYIMNYIVPLCSGKMHVHHAGGHPDDQTEGKEEGPCPILLPG